MKTRMPVKLASDRFQLEGNWCFPPFVLFKGAHLQVRSVRVLVHLELGRAHQLLQGQSHLGGKHLTIPAADHLTADSQEEGGGKLLDSIRARRRVRCTIGKQRNGS